MIRKIYAKIPGTMHDTHDSQENGLFTHDTLYLRKNYVDTFYLRIIYALFTYYIRHLLFIYA